MTRTQARCAGLSSTFLVLALGAPSAEAQIFRPTCMTYRVDVSEPGVRPENTQLEADALESNHYRLPLDWDDNVLGGGNVLFEVVHDSGQPAVSYMFELRDENHTFVASQGPDGMAEFEAFLTLRSYRLTVEVWSDLASTCGGSTCCASLTVIIVADMANCRQLDFTLAPVPLPAPGICPSEGLFRVDCGRQSYGTQCPPFPNVDARIRAGNHAVVDGACIDHVCDVAVACGEVVRLKALPPASPLEPRSARAPFSVSSGIKVLAGEDLELVVIGHDLSGRPSRPGIFSPLKDTTPTGGPGPLLCAPLRTPSEPTCVVTP